MSLVLFFFLARPEALHSFAASGRVLLLNENSSARLNPLAAVPCGLPPLLRFRYLEGNSRNRFGNLDLVVDDAGH